MVLRLRDCYKRDSNNGVAYFAVSNFNEDREVDYLFNASKQYTLALEVGLRKPNFI